MGDNYEVYKDWLSSYHELNNRMVGIQNLANVINAVKQKKEEGMKKGNYLIGSLSHNGAAAEFSASKTPALHSNKILACNEAERLARLTPGKRFVVMEVVGVVEVAAVKWDQ
jgi:hypothetical protein